MSDSQLTREYKSRIHQALPRRFCEIPHSLREGGNSRPKLSMSLKREAKMTAEFEE
ncbi:hypothetical protein ACOTTU_14380 [Roseobacter sp. EG26]